MASGASNVGRAAVAHFEEDAIVTAERLRVDNTPLGTDAITLQHLRKVYTGRPEKVIQFCRENYPGSGPMQFLQHISQQSQAFSSLLHASLYK